MPGPDLSAALKERIAAIDAEISELTHVQGELKSVLRAGEPAENGGRRRRKRKTGGAKPSAPKRIGEEKLQMMRDFIEHNYDDGREFVYKDLQADPAYLSLGISSDNTRTGLVMLADRHVINHVRTGVPGERGGGQTRVWELNSLR